MCNAIKGEDSANYNLTTTEIATTANIKAQLTAADVAAQITNVVVDRYQTKLTMPTVPQGFTVTLKSTTDEDVISSNLAITTSDISDQAAILVFAVAAEDGTDTSDTSPITVTVPKSEKYNVSVVSEGNGTISGGGGASGSIPKSDEPADKPVVQSWINPFSDVKKEDWFYDYVQYVSQNGLMNGTATSLFSPNEKLTRAMFVTVLYRSENEPKISMQNEFSDVQSGEYYEKAVVWAKENGIVNGYSETEFAPHNNITREQIATMVYRYAQYKNVDMSVGENTNILSYEDFDEIMQFRLYSGCAEEE